MIVVIYTHHKLIFGFQNMISPELYIFLNHKVLNLVLLSFWFCSIEKPKFYANSYPEIPKIILQWVLPT